jgi:hypothetical protein
MNTDEKPAHNVTQRAIKAKIFLFSGKRSVKEFQTFLEVDDQIRAAIEKSETKTNSEKFRQSDPTDGRG